MGSDTHTHKHTGKAVPALRPRIHLQSHFYAHVAKSVPDHFWMWLQQSNLTAFSASWEQSHSYLTLSTREGHMLAPGVNNLWLSSYASWTLTYPCQYLVGNQYNIWDTIYLFTLKAQSTRLWQFTLFSHSHSRPFSHAVKNKFTSHDAAELKEETDSAYAATMSSSDQSAWCDMMCKSLKNLCFIETATCMCAEADKMLLLEKYVLILNEILKKHWV